MDPFVAAGLGLGSLCLLMLLHVPIGVAMGIVGVVGFGAFSGWGPAVTLVSTEVSTVVSSSELSVVPLFLLMGNFATLAGISGDVYKLAHTFIGHRRGGLALATFGGCGLFGAVCGSATATAATFGRVALPEMLERRYSQSFAAGCIAAGGTLGIMVPPSVIMVVYAIMSEQFILELFVAAVIPAIIQIGLGLLAIVVYVRIRPEAGPAGTRTSWKQRFLEMRACWRAIVVGVAVFGGIYGGVFTVNEAASIGAALTFMFAITRGATRSLKDFWNALNETAATTAMVYVMIIGASIFAYFVTITRMPNALAVSLANLNVPHVLVVLLLIVFYLALGSIFDELAAMVITLPFVLPIISSMGYDPLWWGIVNVVVIELGMIIPPIGLNVFVIHGISGVPLGTIYRGVTPFIIADLVRLVALVVFPTLVLWLPQLMK